MQLNQIQRQAYNQEQLEQKAAAKPRHEAYNQFMQRQLKQGLGALHKASDKVTAPGSSVESLACQAKVQKWNAKWRLDINDPGLEPAWKRQRLAGVAQQQKWHLAAITNRQV